MDIVVVLQHQAAFEAHAHFFHIVFEAFERFELASVDHHMVADEAHAAVALDEAVGNHTAGNIAHFGNIDNLADFYRAGLLLFLLGSKHTAHGCFHIVDGVVDDVVVADFDVFVFGQLACGTIGTHVEADNEGTGGDG